MKFKRLQRVELIHYEDFGKIVKLYPKTKKYLVVPEGSDQHWTMKEDELMAIPPEVIPTVKIAVRGGVAEVYEKTKGVRVVLTDYDDEDTEHPEGREQVFPRGEEIK